jgi:hypothetical protein
MSVSEGLVYIFSRGPFGIYIDPNSSVPGKFAKVVAYSGEAWASFWVPPNDPVVFQMANPYERLTSAEIMLIEDILIENQHRLYVAANEAVEEKDRKRAEEQERLRKKFGR